MISLQIPSVGISGIRILHELGGMESRYYGAHCLEVQGGMSRIINFVHLVEAASSILSSNWNRLPIVKQVLS